MELLFLAVFAFGMALWWVGMRRQNDWIIATSLACAVVAVIIWSVTYME